MASCYLNQPLLPLALVLPRLLEDVEAELANEKLELAEKSCLRHRAELIH